MDQTKIGKFIAECRKNKNLTQMQLAEKLNITDRAVSKWENGRALPDASIMLQLCEILGITVNDLLCGELVTMDNYNKELEKHLLNAIKQKQESDRQLLKLEVVIGILSCIVLFVPVLLGALLPMEEWQRIIVVFSGFIPAIIGFCYATKIEQTAGYYQCKECGHKYVPTFKAVLNAAHMGRTRYMRCPKCNKKSWQKKVIEK
ncbi:MAG: helix-turn-helix domain-containing protein [Clostridia bacterium]|nr:helix-turn-helix domain-containing protein [Clostridia bacterium]